MVLPMKNDARLYVDIHVLQTVPCLLYTSDAADD